MGTIQIDGSTPKITVGNATAEDATILFDGNAQDFYIALDDSADDLLIGLGSTVGTTPIISMDENKKVSLAADLDVTTVATAATFEPDGDTASGDNAAIGYTSAEGLILTGQGSTSDVTVKNDADTTVFTIPTGTDDILFPDSAKAMLGAASDMTLYHDGTNSYITNKTGALKIATETSGIALTIGHTTSETTIADNLTVTGNINNVTPTEFGLLDGGTSVGSSITLADADGIIVNDGGTMKTIPASDIATYASGGKILQVQSASITSGESTSSTSYEATSLTDQITPAATSSKILILIDGGRGTYGGDACEGSTKVYRQIGGGGYSALRNMHLEQVVASSGYGKPSAAFNYLDNPNTALAVDYKVYFKTNENTYHWNSGNSNMSITLLEVGA